MQCNAKKKNKKKNKKKEKEKKKKGSIYNLSNTCKIIYKQIVSQTKE